MTGHKSSGNPDMLVTPLTKQLVFHEMIDKPFSSQLSIKFQLSIEKLFFPKSSDMKVILLRLISLWWKCKGI